MKCAIALVALAFVPQLIGCEQKAPSAAALTATATADRLAAKAEQPSMTQKTNKASTSEMGIPGKVTVGHSRPSSKKEIVGSSTDVIGDTGQMKGSDYTQGESEVKISDQPVR